MPAGDDLRSAAAEAGERQRPGSRRGRGAAEAGEEPFREKASHAPQLSGDPGPGRGLPVRGPEGLAPVGDGGGPRPDAELGVDPPDMILHGLLSQEQASGDLPVGLPVRDERHDLDLTRGQPVRLSGPVESGADSEPLASTWPKDLVIVHLTSGCGRRTRPAANVPNKVGTASNP